MRHMILSAALGASLLAGATAASAQAIPGAIIAVVDLEKVTRDCNACKTANTALQGQIASLRARQKTLATPLETEGKAIQAAIDALKGGQPDAALQTRIRNFQTKQQQGADELGRQEQQIQRNQQHIQRQIADKLGPVYRQVMQRRGANLMIETGATLAAGAALDVTNDVLTALNTAMPTIQTVAPAQPAAAKPQGR